MDTGTLKNKFDRITDNKIKEYIIEKLKSDSPGPNRNIVEVMKLMDAINVFNDQYSITEHTNREETEKSDIFQLSLFHKKTTGKDFNPNDYLPNTINDIRYDLPPYYAYGQVHSDFNTNIQHAAKLEGMVYFFKRFNNSEISDYLYNEYYIKMLKEQNIPKEELETLKHFNSKYGTKIILEVNSDFVKNAPEIEAEFDKWIKASNEQAKLPNVLDLRTTKVGYHDETSAYGQSSSAGYAELNYSSVSYNSGRFNIKGLIHELTHLNDTKQGGNINAKYNLDEIMPHKTENGIEIIDFKNCKYKEEFLNAGIPPEHVEYAYNNPLEFIAVASEGDMSKYSPEFKQILIDFGMPEWMFKIQ